MQTSAEITRDLVFVGGGHAHVIAIRSLAMNRPAGVRITLVSPDTHTPYSGMLPGLVAGHYAFEDAHIDLARLCQWAGVRFIRTKMLALDPVEQSLTLADRGNMRYDLVSVDTGSQPEIDGTAGARQWAVPVKPVAGFWSRWRDIFLSVQQSPADQPRKITLVGGGAGSVELALAMACKFKGHAVQLELICGSSQILDNYNIAARKSVEAALANYSIAVRVNSRVVSVTSTELQMEDGTSSAYDELLWCTGAAPSSWIATSSLSTDNRGFVAIRDTLQCVEWDNVFAAGDVATQVNHPRPKAGVYAVRQGPVLADNLRAMVSGQALKEHVPQNRFLSLLSLGERRACADWGPFSASGDWVWRWKNRIDREFMARFQDLPDHAAMSSNSSQDSGTENGVQQMPCGGCGAKVGANVLGSVLVELVQKYPEHCAAGGRATDTAELKVPDGSDVVQSIDVLREIVADPWLMGRIAANHALSDLYASGAKPVSALASVTLPFAAATVQREDLKQLLSGALFEFAEVECTLSGGHTLQGSELNLGFVVNGVAMSPQRGFIAKTDVRVGDTLVLTKPLGTGCLFASHMQHRADGRDIEGAVDMMLQSNAQAAQLALEHSASAITDVTGFGLLGHLLEMLHQRFAAVLELGQIPLLSGARQSVHSGIYSTMHEANAQAKQQLEYSATDLDPAMLDLLVDPQTSGGLLISVAPERAERLCDALHNSGYAQAVQIGCIERLSEGQLPCVRVRQ